MNDKQEIKTTLDGRFSAHLFMGDCLTKALGEQQQQASRSMSPPVVIQASARHTATVIFMHGLGDTGHGWAPVFTQIRSPHVKYLLPTAPSTPVTLNLGLTMPSWFDIKGLAADSEEDESGIKSACATVHSLIESELKSGLSCDRIILGGFSQGGGLALYSAITYDKPLGGVIALSCWLPLHHQLPGNHTANQSTPILQCHGDSDMLILPAIGQATAKYLKAFNRNHSMKMYSNMGHSSCDEEIKDVQKFIHKHLP